MTTPLHIPSFLILALFSTVFTLAVSLDVKHHHFVTGNHVKTLQFTLYVHEQYNKTAYFVVKGVAGPTKITKLLNRFGSLAVFNDPLTETPDPSSKVLGYVEGMVATSSLAGERSTCVSRVSLNLKGYKGEHLNVGTASYNQVSELPFVGGTGDFRFAQGYMTVSVVDLSGPATCYKIGF